MFKRLFGAEKSGGGSAPSVGSTGGGGGGKTNPLGAVEKLKDVRHPRSHPHHRGLFFRNPTADGGAVAERKRLRDDVRETSRFRKRLFRSPS